MGQCGIFRQYWREEKNDMQQYSATQIEKDRLYLEKNDNIGKNMSMKMFS